MSKFGSRQWLELAALGSALESCEMELLTRDHDATAKGSGEVRLDEFGEYHFDFAGRTSQPIQMQEFVWRANRDKYDGLNRFRLVATTIDGKKLHCGFVETETLKISSNGEVECSGQVEGLSFDEGALGDVGSEILVLLPQRHWLTEVLRLSFAGKENNGFGRHEVEIAGSTLEFTYHEHSNSLSISVTNGDMFPQTYTEGWLSEPLRMMTGHLVYPRVIVRSNPDRAMVMITQIRNWHRDSYAYSMLAPEDVEDDPQHFFELYSDLLHLVASARNSSGERNFGRHPLTEFYEELAQAMRGSRWIMTLTLASAVEGALDLLAPNSGHDSSFSRGELGALKKHIDEWKGHSESTEESADSLKQSAKQAVSRSTVITAAKKLRALVNEGRIEKAEFKAWDDVRHKVAHGNIFSPYSSAENDRKILQLMSLFRKIARLVAMPERQQ